ncbi:hypothetical protein Mmc1_0183 [Magnetococcus marinus MC-1]|uniref:Lipoprotein n=1 Tax=Magnetococcus marinus (strain ATCC BAA-1437 / JCM 17883 / MC-1) TaxID=156889 RepID=A0L417_MAGMM|nr:hypothetical protein [Magnetococcus marinus]ABK42710.1 hypothetical protein Mmc1_0183 [Magnetococcus marinus MC-1]
MSKTVSPLSFGRAVALLLALTGLSGCASPGLPMGTLSPTEGVGFRESRFAALEALQNYRQCKQEALTMDREARSSGQAARYLASARLFEQCETRLPPGSADVATEERMRAYAVGILDYIKAGDLEQAHVNLDKFRRTFKDQDLYLKGGASFVDSMEILLRRTDPDQFPRYSLLNVDSTLKDEMRRLNHWSHN